MCICVCERVGVWACAWAGIQAGAWVRVRMRARIFPAFAGFFRTRYSKRITQSASTVPMPMAIMILRFVSYMRTQQYAVNEYSMQTPVQSVLESLSERASECMRVYTYAYRFVRAFMRVSWCFLVYVWFLCSRERTHAYVQIHFNVYMHAQSLTCRCADVLTPTHTHAHAPLARYTFLSALQTLPFHRIGSSAC